MDVDLDVSDKRGPEVFQYLIDKYGREYVSNVCTFGCMQMKLVIKDVAKVMGLPFEEVNLFTKNIPEYDQDHNPIAHIADLKKLNIPSVQNFITKHPDVIKYAEVLEGTPRQIGQHPAGIAVSPVPITDLIPVTRGKPTADDKEPGYLSQFEKDQFEQSGLVKLDILKLTAVSQIDAMLALIKKYYPNAPKLFKNGIIKDENIPLDDPKTYELLCRVDVAGIFQMDNEKISKPVLIKVQPKNIDELSAITALIRPGSSGLEEYCAVKSGKKKQTKIDPRIDAILKTTYGAILFQETSMQLISTILGISFGQADIYRRALEKKKKFPDKFKEFEDTFIERGMKNGFSQKVLEYVKQLLIDNAGYSFNQSHAYAYSYITVYMAFIKANFPLAFYAAMLDDDLINLATYIGEARMKNIKILMPDISKSQEHTTIESIEDNSIRIGLNAIKGLGTAAFEPIIKNQPYKSINEFLEKSSGRAINKKVIEALINSDAFNNTPIIFDDPLLTNTSLANKEPIYLDRGQLQKWYTLFYESKSTKAEKNYVISKDALPLKVIEDSTLIFNKDNTLTIPQSRLEEFNLTVNDSRLTVSKTRPKGRLALAQVKVPPFYTPFINHWDDIINSEKNYCQAYIDDIKNNDYSLLDFPYPYYYNPEKPGQKDIIKNIVIGLIQEVKELISKNGRIYYRIELITREKRISQLLLQNEYVSSRQYLQPWKFIIYSGYEDQQYGGLRNRSPIYNADLIVQAGAGIILKSQNKLSRDTEEQILKSLGSTSSQLTSGVLHMFLLNIINTLYNRNDVPPLLLQV